MTSTRAPGGFDRWNAADISGIDAFAGLACPAPTLCIGVGANGAVASSSAPTAGSPSWDISAPVTDRGFVDLSCASRSFCVALRNDLGRSGAAVSSDPAGGRGAWRVFDINAANWLGRVACPSPELCVAINEYGDVASSANPSGGPSAWTSHRIYDAPPTNRLVDLACPSVSLCAAITSGGTLLTSTNPRGGPAAWLATELELAPPRFPNPPGLRGIACPNTSLCVITDSDGNVMISTDPTGGAGTWGITRANNFGSLGRVACTTTLQCVAVDGSMEHVIIGSWVTEPDETT